MYLSYAKGRLYLVERDPYSADYVYADNGIALGDPSIALDPVQGRRLLVLSLQGDILQVVTHPTEPTAEFRSMLCFDHKLLARYYYYAESLSPRRRAGFTLGKFGMLALQGL